MSPFIYPPILLRSSDDNADIWDLFFTLFKKNWPEYSGTIYFSSQFKGIEVEGLNIVNLQYGQLRGFGREMRASLCSIESDALLLILIDFIFMGKVNDNKVREYFKFFIDNNLDTLNFKYYKSIKQYKTENPDLIIVTPPAPSVFFNYQMAFWKKEVLLEMVLPHENPWTSEWFGAKRAQVMHIRQALVSELVGSPIPYNDSGCLSRSKWHPSAIRFLKNEGFEIDFSKRGIANLNLPPTLKKRFQVKKMILFDGIKGSYLDLFIRIISKWLFRK